MISFFVLFFHSVWLLDTFGFHLRHEKLPACELVIGRIHSIQNVSHFYLPLWSLLLHWHVNPLWVFSVRGLRLWSENLTQPLNPGAETLQSETGDNSQGSRLGGQTFVVFDHLKKWLSADMSPV